MKKRVFSVLAQVFVAGALLQSSPADAAPVPAEAMTLEQADFLNRINEARSARGQRSVVLDDQLTHNAQVWAQSMAKNQRLEHQVLASSMLGTSARAENVARGRDIPFMHSRLVLSPTHLQNMTDDKYNHVGIGVARSENGSLYAAQEFGRL